MSKVIRISDQTEKYLKEFKQAALAEEKLTGKRAWYNSIKENDNMLIQAALVQAINAQVNYLKDNGIDIVIKKE